MNQCTLRILVSEELKIASDNSHALVGQNSFVKQYDTDATLRHVRDDFFNTMKDNISVWDCTLYPPKDITDWLFEQWPDRSGSRAKTLYDAGCFPSAIWQVVPKGLQPNLRSVAEDSQYNKQANIRDDDIRVSKVEILGQPVNAKPSQVLSKVKERFHDDNVDEERKEAILCRKSNLRERKAKEDTYHASLEERIKNLDDSNSITSKKVQKMLIRSRCTGMKKLKVQDRVYLRIAIIGKGPVKEVFRYFSRQDTISRVLESLSEANEPSQEIELLVSVSPNSFRRLPLLLRLHEAIERDYIEENDSVILRYFVPPIEDPTTSILQDSLLKTTTAETCKEINMGEPVNKTITSPETEVGKISSQELVQKFNNAIASVDKNSKTKKSTSAKVREMVMKSKSKGDKKRVKVMEDRFFLELIVIEADSGVSSSYVFMSKTDTVQRLLEEHLQESCTTYVNKRENVYIEIFPEQVLEELQRDGILNSFERLIIVKG